MYGARGWSRKYQRRLLISDIFVVSMTMVAAQALWFGWDPLQPVAGPSAPPYWIVTFLIGALWVFQILVIRASEPRILGHGPQEFQRILTASWRTFTIVAVVGFLTQWQVSRGYLLIAIPAGTVMLLAYRALWRKWIHAQRDGGQLQAQVLVVGAPRMAQQMVNRLSDARRAGYRVVGVTMPPGSAIPSELVIEGAFLLGALEDPVTQARAVNADFILLAGNDAMSLAEVRRLGWTLEDTGIGLIVAPSLVDIAGPRVLMSPVEGLPLIHVDAPEFSGAKYAVKTIFDRIGALAMLVVAAIPMAIIAVFVKASSTGPVLFRQERVGLGYEPFKMIKFRSMYIDAEERLADLVTENDGQGALFKLKNDPRVTSVGRFIRRFSLDELPQLFNVLKGDMSVVGPRPALPSEVEAWDDRMRRRQLVKPGITGLWQVSGRSDLNWEQSVRLDLYHAENWTIASDVLILMRTLVTVVRKRGAY
jgi:exopolysaccharide biosynthesis polyprenyl glycosylphosphotransferase